MADIDTEVAIVGGGPSGAALAARLAGQGRDVTLFERRPEPRWRASGVYTSPQTRRALLELGLPAPRVDELVRPVRALIVETLGGAACSLVHHAAGPAAGVDRVALERALLDHAIAAGALVREGAVVRAVRWAVVRRNAPAELDVSRAGRHSRWRARLVVGADGPSSLVARAAGVAIGRVPILRAGITVHRREETTLVADRTATAARLVFGDGWYLGATPVPGARVNLGLVVTKRQLRGRLIRDGTPDSLLRRVEDAVPSAAADTVRWGSVNDDAVVSAYPLAHRVRRLAGPGFVLVGDAAGFIDPVSGEGLYRALSSAEDAADAIARWLAGDRAALARYDARLRARFARKDAISWFLQALMSRPWLLDYAVQRLSRRERARQTLGLVMSDLAPPERALDPRFLASLLAP